MAQVLNRMGFRLRKVVKAKPQKKIKETDAIFDNIKKRWPSRSSAGHVRRLSIDCKATVRLASLSRGGLTRGDHHACDHDLGCKEKYIPCGIVDEDTGQLSIMFGSSYKTSDFIVDTLEARWEALDAPEKAAVEWLQIKMDNGSESSGMRTQFLHRMVQFADHITKPIQLLYSPPYHSKYNPIERCWGILELHWNGTKLIDVETMLEWAKSMTWKGIQPVVELSRQGYQKGISLGKACDGRDRKAIGAPSSVAQVGHSDQPGFNLVNREILFRKSPRKGVTFRIIWIHITFGRVPEACG